MSRIHDYLDHMVSQNLVVFSTPLPALTSPFMENRTMMLVTLAEISSFVHMDDPRPAVEDMIRRFQSDVKGIKLPHVPHNGLTQEEIESLPPHLTISYLKNDVANTLIRLLDLAESE